MNTSWHDRREWEQRLADGRGITAYNTQLLIDDADAAERLEATLEALEHALKTQLGIRVVDATTDDDGGETRLELVREEEDG